MELYGTYLLYLVQKQLKHQDKALSVKEIAVLIHIYETRREQNNFEKRIRRSVYLLLENGMIEMEGHRVSQKNIFITKYKINESTGKVEGNETKS